MISVISPIHNEEKNIVELVKRVNSSMNKCCKNNWEFLLIDDNSTDNSLKIIKNLSREYKNIKFFHHKRNKGQTGCFQTGFDNARGDIIITMDGDLQVLPEDLPLFIEKMNRGYDLINGIRENRQHPFWIKLASRFYNILMLILFNSSLFDHASNYTAIRSKFIKGIKLIDNDHRYLIPILMRRGLKKIGEVIVQHKLREKGKSKYKALPKYLKGFPEIFLAWIRINGGKYDK